MATVLLLVIGVLLALTGCLGGASSTTKTGSTEASAAVGRNMAGPNVQVYIPASVIANKPKPWDLSTPESAVRSYLDWTSYAYRIAESSAATATMSPEEEVRVDSAIQYGLENKKITDMQLTSVEFGKPSKTATSTLLPLKEQWSYSYRSVSKGNKVIAGPYTVNYSSQYTVVKNQNGDWVVTLVRAEKTGGTLK